MAVYLFDKKMHTNKMVLITFYWQHLRNRADLLVLHALPEVFDGLFVWVFSREVK